MITGHVNNNRYIHINLTTSDYNVQLSLYNNSSAHCLYITQHTVFTNSTFPPLYLKLVYVRWFGSLWLHIGYLQVGGGFVSFGMVSGG